MTDLEAAWAAVHDNTPEGWYVGQPMEHPEHNEWSQYAFDPSETPVVGKRSGEDGRGADRVALCADDGLLPR